MFFDTKEECMIDKIDVLDKGYISLIDSFGSDLSVVNAARVSFDKSSESLSVVDISLINYLIKHRHDSVLRHCALTFEVYAPLFVARQWWKHHVSATSVDDQNGWNESSRRYVTEEPEFYIPDAWRGMAANKKQGSGDPLDKEISSRYSYYLASTVDLGVDLYDKAMAEGICVEQARMFLPAYAMYIRWRWTASLNAVLHFISLRLDDHAQWEIREYAGGVKELASAHFPHTLTSWETHRVG